MSRKSQIVAQVVLFGLLLYGCSGIDSAELAGTSAQAWRPGDHTLSIRVAGLERCYVVHIPKDYDPNRHWPVVMMFHGGGGRAGVTMRETDWAGKADRQGFLAVFPEGTRPDPTRPARFVGNPQTWNDGSRRSSIGAVARKVADVEFVSAMIEDLAGRFKVDRRRIYATGFSNGASMAFRIARELSSLVAAVAPVAGADWPENRKPELPVPLIYITGTADPLNPQEGGEVRIGRKSFGTKPATETMINEWVRLHGCRRTPRVVYDKNGARGVAYSRPDGLDAIILYTLQGHGHHWPGGKSLLPERLAGKNVSELDATDVIWEFFKTKSLPALGQTAAPQKAPLKADKPSR